MEGKQQEPDLVALQFVRVTLWHGGGYQKLADLTAATLDRLRAAVENEGAVWLELGLPEMSPNTRAWFEGSLDVWREDPSPVIDWGEVRAVIETLGLTLPGASVQEEEPPDARLLRVLPHVYGRGIFRALRDILSVKRLGSEENLLFPTAGFRPDEAQPGCFWTIRTNVGVVKRAVITIRLPDHLCGGVATDSERQTSGATRLEIPGRFFPFKQPSPRDIAEAIAHHQAATARAVTEPLREELRELEQRYRDLGDNAENETAAETQVAEESSSEEASSKLGKWLIPPAGPDQRDEVAKDRRAIQATRELIYQLERQVARLLRRFGSYGERDDDSGDEFVPREVKLRYRFALDELDLLRGDYRLLDELIAERANSLEQEQRERFQLIAGVLATAILIPTLVAGIAGTSVELPGPEEKGFPILLLFLIGSVAFGIYIINEAWTRTWHPRTTRLTEKRLRLTPLLLALFFFIAALAWFAVIAT